MKGIGIDIVSNARMSKLLAKSTADRFLQKALHRSEIDKYKSIELEKNAVQYMASRWAAKEALVKATRRKDIDFASVWIKTLPDGRHDLTEVHLYFTSKIKHKL